jgi:hypothetical protein
VRAYFAEAARRIGGKKLEFGWKFPVEAALFGYLDRMVLGYLDPGSSSVMFQVVFGGLLFWLLPAVLVARYAQSKGQSFGIYLLIALFLSWVVSLIVLLIVDAIQSSKGETAPPQAPAGSPEQG